MKVHEPLTWLPGWVLYPLWIVLTRAMRDADRSVPPRVTPEGVKLIGLVRWYLCSLEPPRPSWAQLERWSNLDDPATARLRADDVRRTHGPKEA